MNMNGKVVSGYDRLVSPKFKVRYEDSKPWVHYDNKMFEDEEVADLKDELSDNGLVQYGKEDLIPLSHRNREGPSLLVAQLMKDSGLEDVLIGITTPQHVREDKTKYGFDVTYFMPIPEPNSNDNLDSREKIQDILFNLGYEDIAKSMQLEDREVFEALDYMGIAPEHFKNPVNIRKVLNAADSLKNVGIDLNTASAVSA